MRTSILKAAAAVALLATVSSPVRAEPPSSSGFNLLSTSFIATAGTTAFNTTFLYGIAGNSNSLFFRVGGAGSWNKILTAVGATPLATTNPLPGTSFISGLGGPLGVDTEIFFGLCQGNVATFGLCGSGHGPFLTGAGSTNVRVLTSADWNPIVPVGGVAAIVGENVFGFEDVTLASSDNDFNDVVFSTSLLSRSQIPEPASFALVALGLVGVAGAGFRRKQS